jgi:glycosyltransferase 2 family protein
MKNLAGILAVAGLAFAALLFAREGVVSILSLVVAAAPGLVLAALFHVLPMIANARAWWRLLPGPRRPSMRVFAWATWVRESVNALLPVARIGGEIVAYRVVRRRVARSSDVAASLVADMTLAVLSQATFALLGLTLLFASGYTSTASRQVLAGAVTAILLSSGFVLVQHAGVTGTLTRILDRILAGQLIQLHGRSRRFDRSLRAMYDRYGNVSACLAWQIVGWALGAGEIWLALSFLNQQRSLLDAIAIEALIQAVSSAAFFVPGALGVQEGGFIAIGAAIGIDATTALALATARRLRDVIIFLPGLIAWQFAEMQIRSVRSASSMQSP